MVEIWLPLPRFECFLPTPAADPSLRRWEGGISGRGGVSGSASDGAGASRNCEPKSAVRYPKLTTKVIVWVTPKVTKSTITLLVRLMVTGTDQDIPDTLWTRSLSGWLRLSYVLVVVTCSGSPASVSKLWMGGAGGRTDNLLMIFHGWSSSCAVLLTPTVFFVELPRCFGRAGASS